MSLSMGGDVGDRGVGEEDGGMVFSSRINLKWMLEMSTRENAILYAREGRHSSGSKERKKNGMGKMTRI